MSWSSDLQSAKQEITRLMRTGLSQLFLWTLTAKSSAIGDNDAVQSGDDGVDPGAPPNEPKGQRKVIRVQPWGFNGAPPKNLRSLTLRLGSSNLFWIGVGPTNAYGPQSLNPGETALYNSQSGCQVLLDQNGGVTVSDKGGATVKLDGSGNVTVQAASPNGSVTITATPVTGSVKLGPVGTLPVLVQGATDFMGVPITQAPAAAATIVKAG